jgi:hypothetical protein
MNFILALPSNLRSQQIWLTVILVFQLNANLFLSKDRFTRVKISIYFNNINDYISVSSSPTPIVVRLESYVGIFCVQLEFLQQLKLPRNVAQGDCPRTTPNFGSPRSQQWYVMDWANSNDTEEIWHEMEIVQAIH